MFKLTLLSIALLLFSQLALVSTEEPEIKEEERVLVLEDGNFDHAVSNNEFILVEFYAPWCGHCKQLAPEYAKAAQKLFDEGSPVKLGKVDATVEKKLAEKFKIGGFPTLKFFRNGNPTDYKGGRQANDIVNWVTKKSGPPAINLENVEAAKAFVDKDDVVIVGFFKNAEDAEAKAFLNVAAAFDDLPIGISYDEAVKKEYEMENGVSMFRKFDDGRVNYDGDLTVEDDLTSFINSNRLPLVIEFTQASASKIFSGPIKNHLLLFLEKSSETFDDLVAKFKGAASSFKGQVLFVYLDVVEGENKRVLEFFGVSDKDAPTVRYISLEQDMAKFKQDFDDINTENVKDFVERVRDGKVKQHLKTENIPADWDSKAVKVLVGENFNDVARNADKAVLVEFYAPWCGHCKNLEPIWNELGEKYAERSDIVIAKIDSTANEIENVSIRGFPTIKFFPKGSDEIIDFKGERTLDGFSKFLDENVGVAADKKDEL
ncbi:DgyrCDS11019 [Dimorphilus gyrociliatus]|uniref:Protein disulfide-isomerase n=1 Tax=Dimorphilus gyrociliatus TaxID=2664684 RepID=A0A7I8W264_9ANNE|nr:DgyrCDS11019 [Dimorphilus gyrociliatus]